MENKELAGRLAIVTGGASGIGAGVARVLARAGAHVVIADRDTNGALKIVEAIAGEDGSASSIEVDLTNEDSIVQACAQIVRDCGTPWALVNNAGVQDRQLLLNETAAGWDRTLAINTRAPFLMSREIARAMIAGVVGGRIVNVASAAVIGALTHGHAAYASSKTALLGLSRASALELVAHGITVNTILPGGVITPGAIAATGPHPEGPGCRPPPLGFSEPEDIGAAVRFFTGPTANRITNQVLAVDAGWSLT